MERTGISSLLARMKRIAPAMGPRILGINCRNWASISVAFRLIDPARTGVGAKSSMAHFR
jgi:hypothetical protein